MSENETTLADAVGSKTAPETASETALETGAESGAPVSVAFAREALPAAVAVARVFGAYAALALALLLAQARINQALALIARFVPMPATRMDILVWRTEPLTQSRSYVVVLFLVAIAALVHALVIDAIKKWPAAVLAVETALVVAAGAGAFHASPFVGKAFLAGLVPMSVLFAPFVLPAREPRARGSFDTAVAAGLALQSVSLAWGVWIVTFTLPLNAIVGAQIGAWSVSVWRSTKKGRTEDEALAGVPFTLLPIVGLLREPGVVWLALAAASYGLIALALRGSASFRRWARGEARRVTDAVVVTSFWGISAIVTLPYRFRDLPRLNHNSHETGAYATVNSILHGKLMMADAGLIYGPMRSYALTLYTLVAGVTAEQVRLGQAIMNHAVLGLVLAVGWRLVDRKITAMVWYTWLVLVGTLVLLWENYAGTGMNAFGWADVGRIGLPFLATAGGTAAIIRSTRDGLPDRSAIRTLAAWGALAAFATLWAQEFGVCALLALVAAPFVHFLLAPGDLRARARLAAVSVGSVMAGAAAAFGVYLGIYAIYGRARLFLSTVTDQSAAFTSGSYGCFPFPATEQSFLKWTGLTAIAPHQGGTVLEFVAPVAIYLFAIVGLATRAIAGRWRGRDTITLAITVFGLAAFRFALGRADFIHLVTATLPAIALLPRLVVEAARAIYETTATTALVRGIATAAGFGLGLASLNMAGVPLGLGPRLNAIVSGYERPSSGAPYSYPKIPRAGDTKIQPEYVALIEAIRANSTPQDKIFQHIGYMDGGEVYFLADRVNPIRYDVLAEFLTTGRQIIAADEIQKDPPKLVVGEDWGVTGDGVNHFLKTNYHSIGKFGDWELMARN